MQRRPLLIALAVVLITVGALGAAYLTTVVGDTRPVLAVRSDIPRGSTITRADLVEARISVDPALTTVPAADIDTVVGRRAATDLNAGGLVTPQAITDTVTPVAGQSVVGVAVSRAQLPAQPLKNGDRVRILFTPRDGDDLPAKTPAGIPVTVVAVSTVDEATQVVDVTVDEATAGQIATIVATRRVAVILDSSS